MTTKSELEMLLSACEACSDADNASYQDHFNACPECQRYAREAEKLNQQLQFLEELGGKPLDQTKQLLGARIRSFLSMPQQQRQRAVSDLLDGLADISEPARFQIIKARTDLLMEMPKEHRDSLMSLLATIMSGWDAERKQLEQQAVARATEDYFFLKRKMVRHKFTALMS